MQDTSPTTHRDDPGQSSERPTAPSQRHTEKPESDDQRHKSREHVYWWVTGLASIAATGATVIAAIYAIGAYHASWQAVGAAQDQAEIARKSLVAGERPWINVAVSASQVRSNINGMKFTFHFVFQNTGHSPAVMISHHVVLVPDNLGSDVLAAQDDLCRPLRAIPNNKRRDGFTQFPNQELVADTDVYLFWQDIGKMRLDGKERAMPALVGCIDYQFASDPTHHQSGFIFDLSTKDPDGDRFVQGIEIRGINSPDTPVGAINLHPNSGSGNGFYAD